MYLLNRDSTSPTLIKCEILTNHAADMMRLIQTVPELRELYGHCPTWEEALALIHEDMTKDIAAAEARAAQEQAEAEKQAAKGDPYTPDLADTEGIARLYHLFGECLTRAAGRQFVIDEHNRWIVKELFYWAIRAQTKTNLDIKKGVLLMGGNGVGKSTLLRGLADFDRQWRQVRSEQYGFRVVSAREVCSAVYDEGERGLRAYLTPQLAIDELGREPLTTNHFGSAVPVIQNLLGDRYEKHLMTHLATNLTTEAEIANRYGAYVADRLQEMVTPVSMIECPSRRS